jgi:hypothetical protein
MMTWKERTMTEIESYNEAVRQLLESGDSEGCQDLVVVSEKAYRNLRRMFRQATGQDAGIETSDEEE